MTQSSFKSSSTWWPGTLPQEPSLELAEDVDNYANVSTPRRGCIREQQAQQQWIFFILNFGFVLLNILHHAKRYGGVISELFYRNKYLPYGILVNHPLLVCIGYLT